jgi:drug/metabolite transporter (DMT)-like permease
LFKNTSPHLLAILQALFVTFLWSTSWVFIKFGLNDHIPALTFAGLRYTLAFVCLLLVALFRPVLLSPLRTLSRREWGVLILLGLLYYTVNQGAQFLGLAALPAATVNLLLSFTAVVVTILGIYLLSEHPTALQWGGVTLYVIGVVVYFYPIALPAAQVVGVAIVLVGVLGNTFATLIGRNLNQKNHLTPFFITLVSMGIGSIILLVTGVATQGLPTLSASNWLIVGWLALANTAFAFTLWNHTLRTLSAMESSVINNAMLIQIPILAWLFLGESMTGKEVLALVIAGLGILLVQLRRLPSIRVSVRQQS